jgi:hypothetical protein
MTAQSSLRDSCHLNIGNPTLKRRASVGLSLRDAGRGNQGFSLRDVGENAGIVEVSLLSRRDCWE